MRTVRRSLSPHSMCARARAVQVAKQLQKGYTHASAASQAEYEAACSEGGGPPPAPSRGRAAGAAAAAAAATSDTASTAAAAALMPAAAAAAAMVPAGTPAPAALPPSGGGAAPPDAAVAAARPAQRSYHPKLLDARGEVGAAAALLVSLHRAHAAGGAAGSQRWHGSHM